MADDYLKTNLAYILYSPTEIIMDYSECPMFNLHMLKFNFGKDNSINLKTGNQYIKLPYLRFIKSETSDKYRIFDGKQSYTESYEFIENNQLLFKIELTDHGVVFTKFGWALGELNYNSNTVASSFDCTNKYHNVFHPILELLICMGVKVSNLRLTFSDSELHFSRKHTHTWSQIMDSIVSFNLPIPFYINELNEFFNRIRILNAASAICDNLPDDANSVLMTINIRDTNIYQTHSFPLDITFEYGYRQVNINYNNGDHSYFGFKDGHNSPFESIYTIRSNEEEIIMHINPKYIIKLISYPVDVNKPTTAGLQYTYGPNGECTTAVEFNPVLALIISVACHNCFNFGINLYKPILGITTDEN